MAKRVMEPKPRRGHVAPATGHIKVQFNIRPEINRMIDLGAAREETTRSKYIENLVEVAARTWRRNVPLQLALAETDTQKRKNVMLRNLKRAISFCDKL
jgi:hypothetical protein